MAFLKAKAHSGLAQNELVDVTANVGRYWLVITGRFAALAALSVTNEMPHATTYPGNAATTATATITTLDASGIQGVVTVDTSLPGDAAANMVAPREIRTATQWTIS